MDHEVHSFGKADTSDTEPSFAELQRRISEIPDGPSGILNTPKPYRVLNVVGGVGATVALLPFVFVKLMTPAMWMVTMLRIGMAIMLVMWLPTIVRSIGVLGWTLWRWKNDMVLQLDHDHPHYQSILRWLATFPADALAERLRTVQLAERQLVAKLGLLAGGVDRLGILPVLVSAYLFIRNWNQPFDLPGWQILLGIFLMGLYLISATGSLMRIRLRLFESMLADSLARKSTKV
jgi:hypothetical protein